MGGLTLDNDGTGSLDQSRERFFWSSPTDGAFESRDRDTMAIKFTDMDWAIGEARGAGLQTIEGMESLYDAYSGLAYGLALHILREQTAAEDVVQDAFLAMWRARRQYDPEKGPLKSWLLMIVRNRAIDRLRHVRAGSERVVGWDLGGRA